MDKSKVLSQRAEPRIYEFIYVGPSECLRCPWAAGIKVVAIVLGIIFLSEALTFLPERRQLGFRNFAWLLTQKNIRIPIQKKSGTPPFPRTMKYLGGQGGVF